MKKSRLSSFLIFSMPFVASRKIESITTARASLIRIIVTGLYVSLAILNQMNEKAQKIIARTRAIYIPAVFFTESGSVYFSGDANLNLIFK